MKKPSPSVTKCVVCGGRFTPARSDAKYCSGTCRQRAHRARANLSELDQEIEWARLRYWQLIALKARALSASTSQVMTAEAPFVDEDGTVRMHGKVVGKTAPLSPGWSSWGLEAAGPPWSPPPHVRKEAGE